MAEEYSVDKVSLDIEVNSSSSNAKKIDTLSAALDRFSGVIYDFPTATFDNISKKIVTLSAAFSLISGNNKAISGLTSRVGNLNKKISELDTSIMKTKFEQMTTAITPFIDKVNSAKDALVALNSIASGSGKIPKDPTSAPKKTKSNGLLNLAKWSSVYVIGRKIGRVVGQIAQEGANYTETLNLWETAMGNNLDTATKFVDKINEAYGVSEKTLMNAQATFKNMLGSLGQISDETAYRLSEGVTQMALDYASLYNQTFTQAMTKFQAALAGQVRPIRSVSGFDITETTLFQLYQSLGGTKTMRQLNLTEKRLQSIYAIFQQMQASGTVGDLDKTMESFANQSRVASETFQEIVQYSGVLLTHSIQQSGIMVKLNGFLIFLADVLKSVAEEEQAIQHFGDPFASTTEGALSANDAIDKLKGKLLSFDKFQSLSTNEDNALNIDEKLLEALSGYDSILENANMEAQEFARHLKQISGLFDESGAFNPSRWEEIVTNIETIVSLLIGIAALKILSTIGGYFFTFKDGTIVATGALKALQVFLPKLVADFKKLEYGTMGLLTSISLLTIGIFAFVGAWDDMSGVERAIGILGTLTATITALAIAFHATHNWAKSLMIAGMVAGGALMVSSTLASVNQFADGGLPDKGSMFIAGEAGAELVTNMGGGQSGVMNMEQLENAVARGMIVGMSSIDTKDDRPIYINIDGQRFFTASRQIYNRNGYDISKK